MTQLKFFAQPMTATAVNTLIRQNPLTSGETPL